MLSGAVPGLPASACPGPFCPLTQSCPTFRLSERAAFAHCACASATPARKPRARKPPRPEAPAPGSPGARKTPRPEAPHARKPAVPTPRFRCSPSSFLGFHAALHSHVPGYSFHLGMVNFRPAALPSPRSGGFHVLKRSRAVVFLSQSSLSFCPRPDGSAGLSQGHHPGTSRLLAPESHPVS